MKELEIVVLYALLRSLVRACTTAKKRAPGYPDPIIEISLSYS